MLQCGSQCRPWAVQPLARLDTSLRHGGGHSSLLNLLWKVLGHQGSRGFLIGARLYICHTGLLERTFGTPQVTPLERTVEAPCWFPLDLVPVSSSPASVIGVFHCGSLSSWDSQSSVEEKVVWGSLSSHCWRRRCELGQGSEGLGSLSCWYERFLGSLVQTWWATDSVHILERQLQFQLSAGREEVSLFPWLHPPLPGRGAQCLRVRVHREGDPQEA